MLIKVINNSSLHVLLWLTYRSDPLFTLTLRVSTLRPKGRRTRPPASKSAPLKLLPRSPISPHLSPISTYTFSTPPDISRNISSHKSLYKETSDWPETLLMLFSGIWIIGLPDLCSPCDIAQFKLEEQDCNCPAVQQKEPCQLLQTGYPSGHHGTSSIPT